MKITQSYSNITSAMTAILASFFPISFLLTLMMTSAQVVETSVNVITNSPSQDYTHARTIIIYRPRI